MVSPWSSALPNNEMAGMSGMPVCPPRPSIEPKAKYSDSPRRWCPAAGNGRTAGVIAPSSQATTSVSSRPASSVSRGEAPSQPSQDGRLSARVVRDGRGVGAQAHEGGLAEAGQPAHAGQQHQAQRHQRVQADVVQQRDIERRQGMAAPAPAGPGRPGGRSGDSFFFLFDVMALERAPEQHGNDQGEHDDFLVGAGPERGESLDQAHQHRARGASG